MKLPMARMEMDEVTALRWLKARAAGEGLTETASRAEVTAAIAQLASAAPPGLAMWLRWVALLLPQFLLVAGDQLDEPDALHRLADFGEDAAVAQQTTHRDCLLMCSSLSLSRGAAQWRRIAELWEAVEALQAGLPRADSADDVRRLVRRVVEHCPSSTAVVDRMSLDLFEVTR